VDNTLISVIINCYNGGKYLPETIQSVIAQTYDNWEIIFWDNQSTDNSAKIVRNYNDRRIKSYRAPKHTTLGKARNQAIEKANGEWCAFLDSDDLWLPDKLQKQLDIIHNDNSELGLVYGQMLVQCEDSETKFGWSRRMLWYTKKTMMKTLPEGQIFNQLLQINFIPLLTAIFKRDLYAKIGGISEHMEIAEDYDLFLKLAYVTKVRAVQEVVALYRVHDKNISNNKQDQDFLETMEIVSRYMPSRIAARALKVHHTIRAIQEIRNKEIIQGLNRFIKYGGICSLISIFQMKY
jgi:glycosyltransferase involved in cell wall biosynthesis